MGFQWSKEHNSVVQLVTKEVLQAQLNTARGLVSRLEQELELANQEVARILAEEAAEFNNLTKANKPATAPAAQPTPPSAPAKTTAETPSDQAQPSEQTPASDQPAAPASDPNFPPM